MIARVGLVLGLAAAAVAETVAVTCANNVNSLVLVRIGNSIDNYEDVELSCAAGTTQGATATASRSTIQVPMGARFIVVNRANAGLTLAGGSDITCSQQSGNNVNTQEYCVVGSASGTYMLTITTSANSPENFFFDCKMAAASFTAGIIQAAVVPATYESNQQFTCFNQMTTAPASAKFPTASGIVVFANDGNNRDWAVKVLPASTTTQMSAQAGSAVFAGIGQTFGTFTTGSEPSSPCTATASSECLFKDGAYTGNGPNSFDFIARSALATANGGGATGGSNGVNSFCAYTCQSFGPSGATGTCNPNPAAQAAAPAYCRAGSTAVVVQDCPAGQTTGGVVQCIGGGVQQVGQAEINSVFALIAAGRNPRLAFNAFIDALRAQGYGVATAAVCGPCQAQVLANGGGGFVACASCVVLNAQAGVQTRRQVVVGNNAAAAGAVAVVVCPQVGAAAQTECLRAASCAGVFAAGATCSIGGAGAACPVCLNAPRFDEDGSGSKKGLLGLLGLLALIPLCLLLLSSCLLCCLLLRRKKRAVLVPPPVMPTVAPMTSVCEPAVVCGGTAAYPATAGYPGACSPYGGSAYPCV